MNHEVVWRPIVHGDTAERALAIATAVADAGSEREDVFAPLLDAYCALEQDSQLRASRAFDWLDIALAESRHLVRPDLYGGIAGLGFALEHVSTCLSRFSEPPDPDTGKEFDLALIRIVSSYPEKGEYDLVSGLAGIATYAVERLRSDQKNRELAWRLLTAVVNRLLNDSEACNNGRRWLTPPDRISPSQRETFPSGYYNLGVAHGVPALTVILAHAVSLDINRDRAMEVLNDAVNWILSQQESAGDGAGFPAYVAPDRPNIHRPGQAWCYGGLGLSVTLLHASQLVGGTWDEASLKVARLEAAKVPSLSADTCLCHGTAGGAHLFNRLYQATEEEVFLKAATARIHQVLATYDPTVTPTGFRFWEGQPKQLSPNNTFLGGATGVALALMAAAGRTPPNWDRLLLADLGGSICSE